MKLEILKLMADDYNWACNIPDPVKLDLCKALVEINVDERISSYLVMFDDGKPLRVYYSKEEAEQINDANKKYYPKCYVLPFEITK